MGVGKPSGHRCQVPNAVPTCQVLGGWEMGGWDSSDSRASCLEVHSPSACLHPLTQQGWGVCPHG